MIAYIGGKRDSANKILKHIEIGTDQRFYDLCCGSGEISIALVKKGFEPKRITMVDIGPWGLVWEKIGNGKFNQKKFATVCDHFNKSLSIKEWCRQVAKEPIGPNGLYQFLILQACSYGGRPILIRDGHFVISGFREKIDIESLYRRVVQTAKLMLGVQGLAKDLRWYKPKANSVVFCDPPYNKSYYQDYILPEQINSSRFYCTYPTPLAEKFIPLHAAKRRGPHHNQIKEEYLSFIGEASL